MKLQPGRAALVAVMLALSAPAAAQVATAAAPGTGHQARLAGRAGDHAHGRTAINQAAGTGNVQANLAAIALSDGGTALLQLQSEQSVAATGARRDASARINEQAFQASRGVLSINQAAGARNAQANLLGIGRGEHALASLGFGQGLTGLGDAALANVSGDTPGPATGPSAPLREAVIAGDALRSSQGVVQLNQTAGADNRSVNAIVLLLPGGAP